jgi:TetR/AcrR family tetracycline transcriptional repressor
MSRRRQHQAASPATAGRAGLSQQQLVDEALALLQEAGLAGLSTRRLAQRLGVQSPALYWHVRNKDELLRLVADAICAEMALPDAALPPRTRLEAIAREYRRVLTGHRDAPRLFAEQPPVGRHRIALYDAAVGAFLDGGLPAPDAVAMATFYRHYLLGMITEEMRGQAPGGGEAPFDALALGVELSRHADAAREFPNLAGAAKLLTSISPQRLFDIGLKALLDGIDTQLHAPR